MISSRLARELKPSRTEIDAISEDDIEAMGNRTAGTLPQGSATTTDASKEEILKKQFAEISATSQRFKGDNSLGKEAMDDLREKRVMYFEQREDQKRLAKLEKQLKAKPDDADLLAEKNRLETNISDSKLLIEDTLKGRFGGFRAELEAELVKHDQKSATTEKEIEKRGDFFVTTARSTTNQAPPKNLARSSTPTQSGCSRDMDSTLGRSSATRCTSTSSRDTTTSSSVGARPRRTCE